MDIVALTKNKLPKQSAKTAGEDLYKEIGKGMAKIIEDLLKQKETSAITTRIIKEKIIPHQNPDYPIKK